MVKFYSIISSANIQLKNSLGRNTFKFCILIQPIFFGLILGVIYKNARIEDFTLYVLFGSGLSSFWSSICFSSATDIQRERWYGTLENIYIAPSGFQFIIFGKIIGNTIGGVFSVFISIITVILIYNKSIKILYPPFLVISLILIIISFIIIGFFLASIFTLIRNSNMFINVLEYPIYIICGFFFPVEYLPRIIQYISYILPPTWAIKSLGYSLNGEGTVCSFFFLILTSSLFFILSKLIYKIIDVKLRYYNSLENF